MGATSIHVQAVKPGSEIHNFREKELDYVRPELSHLNESWVGDSISHRLESAKQRYLDTVGQKMQAKAAPIREGVIVIKQETTMQELQQFATVCKERFGIEAFQIHIHTNHPGFVLEQALKLGELINIKIDNMKYQHNEIVNGSKEEDELSDDDTELKKYGFVAVSSGDGLSQLFESLNCDKIVAGGQTMNPSTQDILDAVLDVKAENVFVLPNNKNIILAAEQVNELADVNVIVIPTKNMPQGIAAIAVFNEDADLDENISVMNESADLVKCGQVTYAVRDTKINGVDVENGDIMAVIGSDLSVVGSDVNEVAKELAEKLVDEDSGVISIYYGKDIEKEKATELSAYLENKYSDLDVNLNYGGQNVYYYIIAVE